MAGVNIKNGQARGLAMVVCDGAQFRRITPVRRPNEGKFLLAIVANIRNEFSFRLALQLIEGWISDFHFSPPFFKKSVLAFFQLPKWDYWGYFPSCLGGGPDVSQTTRIATSGPEVAAAGLAAASAGGQGHLGQVQHHLVFVLTLLRFFQTNLLNWFNSKK